MNIRIYASGITKKEPMPTSGAWACTLYAQQKDGSWKQVKTHSAGIKATYKNRMELMAIINGLKSIVNPGHNVEIFTECSYVNTSMNSPEDRKNEDLWKELMEQMKRQGNVKITLTDRKDSKELFENVKLAIIAAKDAEHFVTDEFVEKRMESTKKWREAKEKQEAKAAAKYEKNPFRPNDKEQDRSKKDTASKQDVIKEISPQEENPKDIPQKETKQEEKVSKVTLSTKIENIDMKIILVIDGSRFESVESFDTLEEADQRKKELISVLKAVEVPVE